MDLKEIEREALNLAPEERLQLAERLTESLRHTDDEVERAWADLAMKRLQEIREGKDVLVDEEEAMKEIYSALNEAKNSPRSPQRD